MQLPFVLRLLVLAVVAMLGSASDEPAKCERRVLIVGAGINGAATAAFLAARHPPEQLCIDVADEAEQVGGRVKAAQVVVPNGEGGGEGGAAKAVTVELGASVFHDVNQYMAHFASVHGATLSHPYQSAKIAVLGAADGGENAVDAVFGESSWRPVSIAHALWRYGLSPLNMEKCVDSLVARLSAVYDLQRRNMSFASAEQLLDALNLREFTQPEDMTVRAFATSATCGASERFVDEIVHSMTRINYGQGTDISALAGAVAMKGKGDEVHSVAGGNAQLVAAMLKSSGARLALGRRVTLLTEDANDQGRLCDYDAVVIARPLLEEEAAAYGLAAVPMHATFVTLVQGNISLAAYGLRDPPPAATIFTTAASARGRVPFRSVGWLRDVVPSSYKIFSDEPLRDTDFTRLFPTGWTTLATKAWHAAYPKLRPSRRDSEVHPFRMGHLVAGSSARRPCEEGLTAKGPRIYHAGALEFAVSTMETQCIAAANTALLVSADLFPVSNAGQARHAARDEATPDVLGDDL